MRLRVLTVGLLGAAALLVPVAAGGRDAVPPETTITSGPAPLVSFGSATFTFTSNQEQSRFACSIDSDAFVDCATPYSITVPDGVHRLSVVAVRGALSDPTPAVWTWTVDTTPPALEERTVVGYGRLALAWGAPSAMGADRVVVLQSTDPKKDPAREVYRGSGAGYVDAKFVNGVYHRYRIIAWDQAGNQSAPVDVVVAASALLLSPKDGSRLRPPTVLRWRTVRKATFYNVQLYRGGKKILSAWPRVPHLKATRSWRYLGHRFRLRPGHYTWDVWPGFGPLAKARYGALLGEGRFDVAG